MNQAIKLRLIVQLTLPFEIDLTSKNENWRVSELSFKENVNQRHSVITMSFKISRRSLYIMINLVSPLVIYCLLNLFVFYLPESSVERISFSLTMLLSIILYLNTITEDYHQQDRLVWFTFALLLKLLQVVLLSWCLFLHFVFRRTTIFKNQYQRRGRNLLDSCFYWKVQKITSNQRYMQVLFKKLKTKRIHQRKLRNTTKQIPIR